MNFLKLWVMLKQIRRGVAPDRELLKKAIEFVEPYARKNLKEREQ